MIDTRFFFNYSYHTVLISSLKSTDQIDILLGLREKYDRIEENGSKKQVLVFIYRMNIFMYVVALH